MRPTVMRTRLLVAAALTSVLLAACGTSPPSARSLISRIPGCASPVSKAGLTSVYAQQEYTCTTPYAVIDLATFSGHSDELSWIRAQGAYNGTCCVEGDSWAATVSADQIPANPSFLKVARAIGGRDITYP